jgi:hypothetical protein
MTPLPLAYPDDPEVYKLANTERRSYQWLIGESLMATPLYGDDYATAGARDVYLPAGKWMDYDTGKIYEGPRTLKDFTLPVNKTPLFVGDPGILVEQSDDCDSLEAVVYPVSPRNAQLRFTWPDGKTVSLIANGARNWVNERLTVVEQKSKETVVFACDPETEAIRFPLAHGRSYEVRDHEDGD